MRRTALPALLGLGLVAATPPSAAAQGFSFNEQSACVAGRGGAGVAAACHDGSTIFYNPANVAGHAAVFSVGGFATVPEGRFRSGQTGLITPINENVSGTPNAYFVKPLNKTFTAGLGVFTPYNLQLEWPRTSQGRLLAYASELRTTHVQPTLAAQFGALKIGAGLNVALASMRLRQRLELSSQPTPLPGVTFGQAGIPFGTDFADVNVSDTDVGVGYHLGFSYAFDESVSFGARYLSRQKITFDGATAEITQVPTRLVVPANIPNPANPAQTAIPVGTPIDALVAPQFLPGGRLSAQSAYSVARTPEQFVAGFAAKSAKVQFLADLTWTNWAVFNEFPIVYERLGGFQNPQNFDETIGGRIGLEYKLSGATTIRGGYAINGAATPANNVTPFLPESDRSQFSVGVGTRLTKYLVADLAYQYTDQADRAGRVLSGGLEQNTGVYRFSAHQLGATFAFAF